MAAARFSSDVIKRMAETGDLIVFTETIIETFDERIIESGDTNFQEEGVILKKNVNIFVLRVAMNLPNGAR